MEKIKRCGFPDRFITMITKLKETVGAYGTNTEGKLCFPVKPETTNDPPVKPLICLYKA